MSTESPTDRRAAAAPAERPHNPCREAVQERVVRQIRMLRAMRRELETGLRRLLHGHEGGNPGHSQGAAYGLPRQFPTLPGSPQNDCSRRNPRMERHRTSLIRSTEGRTTILTMFLDLRADDASSCDASCVVLVRSFAIMELLRRMFDSSAGQNGHERARD